ncbi:unnamed protein product [Effrenium voratum]|nr:unnamed protein product [Effrenium voratum]|eukprot:CAMPEP_0181441904 /NCGR_PEP_ID=MMETSP1110-20121109/23749_1 /TAXON_ID=174948 /ORGANISM="Symbiodinium sp., Strain CCMP421" /LENGTH=381 /DNA_ID=CAMNT_0023565805 /DNA_START=66 /DNA_END=1211 /DNA_ORIENTATION=+
MNTAMYRILFLAWLCQAQEIASCPSLLQVKKAASPWTFLRHLVSSWLKPDPEPAFGCRQNLGEPEAAAILADYALQDASQQTGSTGGRGIFSIERWDGIGERTGSIIYFQAVANKVGLPFGGVVSVPVSDTSALDKAREDKVIGHLLGVDYQQLVQGEMPVFEQCCWQCNNLTALTDSTLMACNHEIESMQWEGLLTSDFLFKLRNSSGIFSQPTPHFTGGPRRLKVAFHLRRGDVTERRAETTPLAYAHRYVPDETYYELVDQVRSVLPADAEVQTFSSTGKRYAPSQFGGFRAKGLNVHLDGEELSDMAHMAQADVLIMAPSTFSWVPGLLNARCVVSFRGFLPMLPEWIGHDQAAFSLDDMAKLSRCVAELSNSNVGA